MLRSLRYPFAACTLAASPIAAVAQLPAIDTAAVVTIHAATLLDGRGGVLRDARVTVRGTRIARVETGVRGRATHELGTLTLLPGLVDTHVHPGWYITGRGALHRANDGDKPTQCALAMAGYLFAMLLAGVITIQSIVGLE